MALEKEDLQAIGSMIATAVAEATKPMYEVLGSVIKQQQPASNPTPAEPEESDPDFSSFERAAKSLWGEDYQIGK